MAYNSLNYLKKCKNVIDIVNANYIEGVTSYAGVFRRYVYHRYPMSYKTFMQIISMPDVDMLIEREEDRLAKAKRHGALCNQLSLFGDDF
jgi:hypothetical protein